MMSSLVVVFSASGVSTMQALTVSPRLGSGARSEEHTSELQSRPHLVCRLLLEKKKQTKAKHIQLKKAIAEIHHVTLPPSGTCRTSTLITNHLTRPTALSRLRDACCITPPSAC